MQQEVTAADSSAMPLISEMRANIRQRREHMMRIAELEIEQGRARADNALDQIDSGINV